MILSHQLFNSSSKFPLSLALPAMKIALLSDLAKEGVTIDESLMIVNCAKEGRIMMVGNF